MKPVDRVLAAAMTSDISHGAFRLYAILEGASRQANAADEYFPVTLEGLRDVHPGTAGRPVGATTVIKQVAELRKHQLIDTRAAIHRTEPRKPVLVRIRTVATPTGKVNDRANQQ